MSHTYLELLHLVQAWIFIPGPSSPSPGSLHHSSLLSVTYKCIFLLLGMRRQSVWGQAAYQGPETNITFPSLSFSLLFSAFIISGIVWFHFLRRLQLVVTFGPMNKLLPTRCEELRLNKKDWILPFRELLTNALLYSLPLASWQGGTNSYNTTA